MAGVVHGVAGLATSVGAQAQPVNPQYGYYTPSPPVATQAQPYVNPQYGYYTPSPPGATQYHTNSGTHSIQGDLKQDGTFKGHGTGAKIQGGFNASGDIQ